MKKLISSFILLSIMATTSLAQHQHHGDKEMKETDAASEEVVQVLDNFRMAIIDNDQEKASTMLTNDARILESGGIETKGEYLSHHFHSDGKFLSAMQREVKTQEVKYSENTAWVSTVSHMQGTYDESQISINSAGLAVLVKTDAGWKISSVHWSSASAE